MKNYERDAALLTQYIAAFETFDDTYAEEMCPLHTHADEDGRLHRQPRKITTSPLALDGLYQGLGFAGCGSTRFPPLYELLILSYRWVEVNLGNYRLLANEPAEDLFPLLSAMRVDTALFATLVPNGYIPFGKGPEVDYDPVCFDFRQRQNNGDCRIVRLDHEAILCHRRIEAVTELAPNFRYLALNTIEQADAKQKSSV